MLNYSLSGHNEISQASSIPFKIFPLFNGINLAGNNQIKIKQWRGEKERKTGKGKRRYDDQSMGKLEENRERDGEREKEREREKYQKLRGTKYDVVSCVGSWQRKRILVEKWQNTNKFCSLINNNVTTVVSQF